MKQVPLAQARLKELLSYDPLTGDLIWRVDKGTAKKGSVAGCIKSDSGYRVIGVDGVLYRAHRLAWLWAKGFFSEHYLDHINGSRDDNRLVNLREVSPQCNVRNTGDFKHNTSGVKGVTWHSRGNKWMAQIKTGRGSGYYLGLHDDFTEAVAHRLAAEQCVGWPGCRRDTPAAKFMLVFLRGIKP